MFLGIILFYKRILVSSIHTIVILVLHLVMSCLLKGMTMYRYVKQQQQISLVTQVSPLLHVTMKYTPIHFPINYAVKYSIVGTILNSLVADHRSFLVETL